MTKSELQAQAESELKAEFGFQKYMELSGKKRTKMIEDRIVKISNKAKKGKTLDELTDVEIEDAINNF